MHVIEWPLCGFVYTRLTCNTPFYFVVMASMKRKYEDMTNKELVEELRARKAKVSGRKKASQSSGDFVYNVRNEGCLACYCDVGSLHSLRMDWLGLLVAGLILVGLHI